MESTVKDRLKLFLKEKNITQKDFATQIGASAGYINSMRKGVSDAALQQIMAVFPDLNRDWLLYGEGDMLKPKEGNVAFLGVARNAMGEGTVPVRFFEVTPTATFQEFCAGESESPTSIEILPVGGEALDESFCVFEIRGDSMAPQINDYARVLCQEVPPTKWHTLNKCVVVIAYADKFVIKRITANRLQSEDWLELASDNPDYPSKEKVPFAEIRCIFQAKRIVSSMIV